MASEEGSVLGLFFIQRLAIADRRFGTSLCTIAIDKLPRAISRPVKLCAVIDRAYSQTPLIKLRFMPR
jgi:hypothetical protein